MCKHTKDDTKSKRNEFYYKQTTVTSKVTPSNHPILSRWILTVITSNCKDIWKSKHLDANRTISFTKISRNYQWGRQTLLMYQHSEAIFFQLSFTQFENKPFKMFKHQYFHLNTEKGGHVTFLIEETNSEYVIH